ncbi:MAG TPA: DUF2452 domain-containing protein [Polyangiaceae bacterium]|nr:DUF2452 domain-containing protein [Polyangiaceae bacterium]
MSDESQSPPGGGRHGGPEHASPYPLSRLAPRFDLVDAAREIQQADTLLGAVVGNKLSLIADQIRALQAQARAVVEEARESSDLHRVECRFQKAAGGIYHLYRRPDGKRYFSLLSLDDWGGSPPHAFEGSFRLEADMSFTPVERLAERSEKEEIVRLLTEGLGGR